MDRRTMFVDCDDTLLMHNKSEFPETMWVSVECNGRTFTGVPNRFNVLLVEKFYRLGYSIVVWSKTGQSWAQAVGRAVGIDQYVDTYLSKPDWLLDDKPVEYWCGPRLWRNPHTGKEE